MHLWFLPAYLLYLRSSARPIVDADIERWQSITGFKGSRRHAFAHLMRYYPEFRSLIYYRLPRLRSLRLFFGPGAPALYINTPNIGPRLVHSARLRHHHSSKINWRELLDQPASDDRLH